MPPSCPPVTNPHAVSSLQSDLDDLVSWSDTLQLPFNEAKSSVLHIGCNNPGCQYMTSDAELTEVQAEKDPGVHINSELKFRYHASAAVAKATQILAL